jgi:hypothetical protein
MRHNALFSMQLLIKIFENGRKLLKENYGRDYTEEEIKSVANSISNVWQMMMQRCNDIADLNRNVVDNHLVKNVSGHIPKQEELTNPVVKQDASDIAKNALAENKKGDEMK